MQQRAVTVTVPGGIHARVAAELSDLAGRYASSVFLVAGRMTSVARSWDVLGLGVGQGDEVTVIADGRDEKEALEAVIALLGHGASTATGRATPGSSSSGR